MSKKISETEEIHSITLRIPHSTWLYLKKRETDNRLNTRLKMSGYIRMLIEKDKKEYLENIDIT